MSDEDFKSMSHQYFYENYCKVNGEAPPPLSEFDKQFLAACDDIKEGEQIFLIKARGRNRLLKIVQDKLQRSLSK